MIITTADQLVILEKKLKDSLYIAYDLETSGLNPRKNSIIGIALGTATWQAYIVLQSWSGTELIDVLPKASVAPLLKQLQSKRLIMHNASFDIRFTRAQLNVDLAPALHSDTMLMQHTINENLFSYGLKELGSMYFGSNVTNEKQAMVESIKANGGTGKEFYKADTSLMATYAMQDVALTMRLYNLLGPRLKAESLENFFYKDEVMPLLKEVTIDMEYRGIPVNVPALQQAQTEIVADLKVLEDEIQAEIAPLLTAFNSWYLESKFPYVASNKFFNKLATKIAPPNWPRTATGGYSFSKAELAKAIKKGLVEPDTDLQKYAVDLTLRVPQTLQRELQLEFFKEETGTYPFNLLSKDHLKRLFFGTSTTPSPLKEVPLSKTDKGAPQVNDEFLDLMATKYPWASKLQIYNKLIKLKSTYIERFLEGQEKGIFYPGFSQHKTVSGRYSGDTQQLPRPIEEKDKETVDPRIYKYNNMIRTFFISAPNWSFADFDYDSQEVKVFAHVSGEQAIKNIFKNNEDFYSAVCIAATGLKGYSADKKAENYLGKANKKKRQEAKAYALGLAFNMSAYKLKFELNCSEEEAKKVYNNYFAAYPNLKKWLDNSLKFAMENGYIKTESGRVRRFPGLVQDLSKYGLCLLDGLELWKKYHSTPDIYNFAKARSKVVKNYLNNAANVQIQGLAASITNRSAIATSRALKKEGLEAYICNVIHDQITVHSPDSELEKVMKILENCMENTYKISVPLTAPPSHGKNWAESK